MKTPKKHTPKPRVHQELNGLEVSIDSFGEISSNTPIDKINEFLNKNVDDKKLKERDGKPRKRGKGKK